MLAMGIVGAFALTACSGANTSGGTAAPGKSSGGGELNVLMVGNPQMKDLEKLGPANFTKKTGIKVNFTILPENELRDRVAQDVATKAGQYDVVTIGAYEGSVWTANDWLTNLQPLADKDTAFAVGDILPAMKSVLSKDNNFYAIPFYGESAFTMYRKDLFDKYGLTMPAEPTWTDIETLAAKLKGKEPGVSSVCLRGLPGWGENMAVVGSMINSFGGTFLNADWSAQMNSPGTSNAIKTTSTSVTKYGENGATQAGFTECLNNFAQGKSAIWFDATSAANSVESPTSSKVVGKIGYADAPRDTGSGRLGLGVGLGSPQDHQERGQRLEVHLLGLGQGVRVGGPAHSSAGHASLTASASRPSTSRSTRQPPRPTARRCSTPWKSPTRATVVCSLVQPQAVSTWRSLSSPTWEPRSARKSVPRWPVRRPSRRPWMLHRSWPKQSRQRRSSSRW